MLGNISDEQLLELYLSMSSKQRNEKFSNTAQAAELAGISQRTIQFWIEIGVIRAVPIGKKYQVDLSSLKEYLKSRIDKRD